MMGPDGRKMPGELESAITASFGSIDEFKAQFVATGVGQFGCGWCWLVQDASGTLPLPKQKRGVNPLCFGQTALLVMYGSIPVH